MATLLAPDRTDDEAPAAPVVSRRRSLLGLISIVALLIIGVVSGFGWTVLAIVSLLTVVLLHEAGHFITAKLTGMKATEFFVGFGPRVWSFRRGETEYGLKALPLGGYVRIIGFTATEEVAPADEPRSYMNQAFWKRIVVSAAGSAVHFTLAIVLAFGLVWSLGQTRVDGLTIGSVATFAGGSPASAAGLASGDTITSIDGHVVRSVDAAIATLHHSVGEPLAITYRTSTGVIHHAVVTPVDGTTAILDGHPYLTAAQAAAAGGAGVIGVGGVIAATVHQSVSPWFAAKRSLSTVWELTTRTTSGLLQRFSPSGLAQLAHLDLHPSTASTPTALASRPTSIVGMVHIASDAVAQGITPFLELLIVINVAIGLLNLLPMLPLDGGHIAIAVYERIRTRRGQAHYRADISKLMPVVYTFLVLLGFLVLSSVYLDITHPIPNPFTQ
jgi:membrane-associated protease RseP (regulator of RpoE activity)